MADGDAALLVGMGAGGGGQADEGKDEGAAVHVVHIYVVNLRRLCCVIGVVESCSYSYFYHLVDVDSLAHDLLAAWTFAIFKYFLPK